MVESIYTIVLIPKFQTLPSHNRYFESYTFFFISVAPTINHDLTTKSPQTVAEGQNITLTCVVSAEPPASIMWIYFNPNNPDAKDRKSSQSYAQCEHNVEHTKRRHLISLSFHSLLS